MVAILKTYCVTRNEFKKCRKAKYLLALDHVMQYGFRVIM